MPTAISSLVGGYLHVLDVREVVQGLECHDHDDGGAVGVGDDVARGDEGVLTVDLGHHQGHIVVHAEGAAVVDHDAAVLGDGGGELAGGPCAHGDEGDVDVLEVVVVLQEFDDVVLAAESENAARTAF